jgi:hypothetical protein
MAQQSDNITETQNSSRQARFDERKFRFDQDKKELSQFLNTKNIVRTIVKLLFGSTEESTATSRQVLNVLVKVCQIFFSRLPKINYLIIVLNVKVLDMLKSSFGQRARTSSSRGIRDSLDDAAVAGISMLKGYVRSVLTSEEQCTQKYICEAAARASREGRELGYLIAQFGGYVLKKFLLLFKDNLLLLFFYSYASSYLLENQKSVPFNSNYEASRQGRNGADCTKLYQACNEAE